MKYVSTFRYNKDIKTRFLITIDCLREDYSLPLIRSIRKKVSEPNIIFKNITQMDPILLLHSQLCLLRHLFYARVV